MYNQKNKFELSPRLKLGVGRGYSHHNRILKISALLCLILAAGLAFHAIQLVWNSKNVMSTAGAASPQVLGASDTKTDPSAVEFIEYKVQKGDTLFNVSQKFQINWSTLAALNDLKGSLSLKPGQILKVPKQ